MSRLISFLSMSPLRLAAIANTVVCGLLLIASVTAGLLPAATKFHLYGSPIPIFIAATALCGALFFIAEVTVSERVRKRYGLIVAAVLFINLVTLIVVGYALESHGYTWDSELVFDQAVNFAVKGSIDNSFIDYVIASPNNIALLAGIGGLFRFLHGLGVTDFLSVAVGINIALLFISEVLTFFVVKMLYGRRIALIALGFCFVFISMSMYVEIFYTDTLTIAFPILLLFLALSFVRTQNLWARGALALSIGIVAIVGYYLKPTVAIAAGVIIGVAALALLTRRFKVGVKTGGRRGLLIAGICIVCGGVGAVAARSGFIAYVNGLGILPYPMAEANDNSYPIVHFLDIGMKYRVYDGIPYYGGYNDQSAQAVAALPTEQQKVDYSMASIRSQLAAFGPLGYANFLAHKAHWILSDATFYAYGEGSNSHVVFVHSDPVSQWFRSFMYIGGAWYILFGNILQVFWIALLLLIGVQVVVLCYNRTSRENLYVLIPRLMLAGIIVFLLFFEGRSRYIFLYVPVFIVTALYTLSWYRDLGSRKPVRTATDAAKP